MGNAGRKKYQAEKQYSPDPKDSGQNKLFALYGQAALSNHYRLATEIKLARDVINKIEKVRLVDPECGEKLHQQVEEIVNAAGRFVVNADIKELKIFVETYATLEEQKGRIADPRRLILQNHYDQLAYKLIRLPTRAELLHSASKQDRTISTMHERQFRRICKKELGLEFTLAKTLSKLCTAYRQLRKKLKGGTPSVSEFQTIAVSKGLLFSKLCEKDFCASCVASELRFSDSAVVLSSVIDIGRTPES